jgi:hypothetical protein
VVSVGPAAGKELVGCVLRPRLLTSAGLSGVKFSRTCYLGSPGSGSDPVKEFTAFYFAG